MDPYTHAYINILFFPVCQYTGIAGNIVHAIATTNAIAGGLQVLEGIKVIAGHVDQCRTTWIKRSLPKLLQPQSMCKPNPDCYACARQTLQLRVNTNTFTVQQFFDIVCSKLLGMNEAHIDVTSHNKTIGLMEDLGSDYRANVLSHPSVKLMHNSLCQLDDFDQDFQVQIQIIHDESIVELEHPDMCILIGSKAKAGNENENDDDDKLIEGTSSTSSKSTSLESLSSSSSSTTKSSAQKRITELSTHSTTDIEEKQQSSIDVSTGSLKSTTSTLQNTVNVDVDDDIDIAVGNGPNEKSAAELNSKKRKINQTNDVVCIDLDDDNYDNSRNKLQKL
jgi:ubiquitin-like 1-activating enzyme E1 B